MKLPEFKELVQSLFPFPFDEILISEEVDTIINTAILFATTSMEVIRSRTISSSMDIPEAAVIIKVLPSTYISSESGKREYNVFDMVRMSSRSSTTPSFYFTPERRLCIEPAAGAMYVEYVVDPKYVTIEDFDMNYIKWTASYSCALLSIKEGYAGTRAILSALPFEFNYAKLNEDGIQAKADLEQKLSDMFYGCFSMRP